jgi:antibiotic biosynthesis monooxygenase (ABM) superfamily enzyme
MAERAGVPARWKSAVVVWLGLYPLLQLATVTVIPRLDGVPGPLRTLVVSVVLVILVTYGTAPALRRLLRDWL